MSGIISWMYLIPLYSCFFFLGFPLHSAPTSATPSAINVDFDAVFGGKSAAPQYRTAGGKSCLIISLHPTGNAVLTS